MRKLREVKQIRGKPAHHGACAVCIKIIKAHLLDMGKEILPYIRLNANTEGMPVIAHNIVKHRAQYVAGDHNGYHRKKRYIQLIGQHIVKRLPCNHGKGKVDGRYCRCAQYVCGKYSLMPRKISQKNCKRPLFSVLLGRHPIPPFIKPRFFVF